MTGVLQIDERRRLRSFGNEKARTRYIAARWVLRQLLAGYMAIAPADLRILEGAYGKPRLEQNSLTMSEAEELHFSISHSGDVCVYGISRGGPIGVDVEQLRSLSARESILLRYASEEERLEFSQLGTQEEHVRGFYSWWTQHEALAKAVGIGFPFGMRQISMRVPVPQSEYSVEVPGAVAADQFAAPGQRFAMTVFAPAEERRGRLMVAAAVAV